MGTIYWSLLQRLLIDSRRFEMDIFSQLPLLDRIKVVRVHGFQIHQTATALKLYRETKNGLRFVERFENNNQGLDRILDNIKLLNGKD